MTTTTEYRWHRIWRDSQTDEDGNFYGLTVFQDKNTGRFAIRDMSGDLPHLTDDGVLWLDNFRPISFCLSDLHGRGQNTYAAASIPVICERSPDDRRCSTSLRWQDAIAMIRHLNTNWGFRFRVEVDPTIGNLLRLLMDVALLPLEREGE